uniref:Uncharacterized protein n=1 Tax=Candidatus Kentrum sp. LFY TaxID=2126342 RepID=A0A450UL86_9GAMM|nr:MAG: conserved hypothetical protein [Candidatus Kentron sp. LFY]
MPNYPIMEMVCLFLLYPLDQGKSRKNTSPAGFETNKKEGYAMQTIRKFLSCAVGCFLVLPVAYAGTEDPIHDFSANVSFTTEYLFRGVTQTKEGPAIQGGFDYTHTPSGFYLGTWASNVTFKTAKNIDDPAVEMDFYGGIAGELGNGVSWDVGGIYYHYLGQDKDAAGDYDCLEVYGGLGYTFADSALKPAVGAKLSYSDDYFGEDGNSLYSEGSLGLSLPRDFGLGFHLGFSDVEGGKTSPKGYDYLHGSVALSRKIADFDVNLTYHGVIDEDDCPGGDKDPCKAVVFKVSRGF